MANAGVSPTVQLNRGVTVSSTESCGLVRRIPLGKVAAEVTSGVPQPRFEFGASRFDPAA